jgi:ribosomal protein L27
VFATVTGHVKFDHERRDKKRISVVPAAAEASA